MKLFVSVLVLAFICVQCSGNECLTALNLTEGANAEDEIHLFVTPNAERVPLRTPLRFLCCFLAGPESLGTGYPHWETNPMIRIVDDQDGNFGDVWYLTMNLIALPNINNTEISCVSSSSKPIHSNVYTLKVIGKRWLSLIKCFSYTLAFVFRSTSTS